MGKLVDGLGKFKDWERYEQIAYSLQDMLVDLDIVGLVVHQINKKEMGQKPTKQGIAGGKGVAYEAVSAHAQKLKLMDGGIRSDIDYYIQAANEGPGGQQVQNREIIPNVQKPAQTVAQHKATQTRVVSKDKRKSAGGNNQKIEIPSIQDINDMSDDDLMDYRAKIMANR